MNKRSLLDLIYRRKLALERNIVTLDNNKNYPADQADRLIQLHKAEIAHNRNEIFFLDKIIDEVIA